MGYSQNKQTKYQLKPEKIYFHRFPGISPKKNWLKKQMEKQIKNKQTKKEKRRRSFFPLFKITKNRREDHNTINMKHSEERERSI